MYVVCFFFFKQKTAYEMRISDWSSDVCSSDLFASRSLSRKAPMSLFLRVQTIAATIDPPLAPDMIAGNTPSSHKAFTTPIWKNRKLPEPDSSSAERDRKSTRLNSSH